MAIEALIFDFAGVIGSEAYWAWLEANVEGYDKKVNHFMELSYQVDSGQLSEEKFVAALAEASGVAPSQIREGVFSRLEINEPLVQLIRKLRPAYQTALLSNFVYEWLHDILQRHDLYTAFDQVLISSKVRMIKPDPDIYLSMLRLLNVEPAQAVFVDDRLKNVEAARRLGISAILYTDFPSLQTDFRQLGIPA